MGCGNCPSCLQPLQAWEVGSISWLLGFEIIFRDLAQAVPERAAGHPPCLALKLLWGEAGGCKQPD